jgi:hypothetical protein
MLEQPSFSSLRQLHAVESGQLYRKSNVRLPECMHKMQAGQGLGITRSACMHAAEVMSAIVNFQQSVTAFSMCTQQHTYLRTPTHQLERSSD